VSAKMPNIKWHITLGATRLPRKYSVYPFAEKSTGKRFSEASI
jgi:hypothetical protein